MNKTTVKELVESSIIHEPMDGNHGELHPTAKDYVTTGIPFIMAVDIESGSVKYDTCKYISEETAKKLRKGFANEGDVLLTHKGTIGRTALLTQLPTDYIVLTPQVTYYRVINKDLLNPSYLKYYFDSPLFQTILKKRACAGSTRAYIGIIEQLNLPIFYPDIKRQNDIVGILKVLDDKIRNNNCICLELESLAKTIYDYWFLQFEFPNEEGLPYKSSGGKMVWSEELMREIPVIFTKINVMDLIEVKDGTHDSPKYVSEGKYLVTSKHLLDRGINFEEANHISDRDFELINQRSKVDTGDILFSMIGAVGTVYRVDEEIINFAIKNVALYKTSANTEYEYYLYWTLKSELMNQYIKNVMAGSIQKFIPLGSLRTMPITYNKNIIKIFSEVVGPIMKTMSQIKKETKELAALRDWLLPMLMNGQVGFKEEVTST